MFLVYQKYIKLVCYFYYNHKVPRNKGDKRRDLLKDAKIHI